MPENPNQQENPEDQEPEPGVFEVVDPPSDPETSDPYRDALFKAWNELSDLQEEEKRLIIRKARLKQTSDALWPLAFPDDDYPDINSMTLADAIRLMVQCYCTPERSISIKEIRAKLQDIGYDLAKYKNPLASIHTAANRMVESDEINWVDDEGNKLKAGPEMKPVLTSEPNPTAVRGLMGQNSAGEK
jgi:hypothetical protein